MDAEAVGDAIDVGVVGGDGANVEHITIGESNVEQRGHIGFGHLAWCTGQLLHIVEHCLTFCAESCGAPIGLDGVKKLIVLEEASQTATVVGDSVVALVDVAHDQRNDLPFDFAEGSGAGHCRGVDGEVSLHGWWVERMDLHYVVDAVMVTISELPVQVGQIAIPLVLAERFYPSHRSYWWGCSTRSGTGRAAALSRSPCTMPWSIRPTTSG